MASAAAAASAKNNRRNNKSANNIKIISFNVASPEFMCFNMHIPPSSEGSKYGCHANKETPENTEKRASLIVDQLNLQNDVDFMCFQEMFPELNTKIQENKENFQNMTHMNTIHPDNTTQTYYNIKKWTVTDLGFQKYYNTKFNLGVTFSSGGVGTQDTKSCRTNILLCENKKNVNEKFILINVHGEGSSKVKNEQLFNFINNYINGFKIDTEEIIADTDEIKNDKKEIIRLRSEHKMDENKNLRTITVGDFNYDPDSKEKQTEYIDIENIFNSDIIYNNLDKKTSYHRWVWKEGQFTDKKGTDKQYALYDYVLLKKDSFKEVKITRIPKNFGKIEVPYKCVENEQEEIVCSPNFEGPSGFPSDHTMNIYEIDLNISKKTFPNTSKSTRKNDEGNNSKVPLWVPEEHGHSQGPLRIPQEQGHSQGPLWIPQEQGYSPTGQQGYSPTGQQGYYPQQTGQQVYYPQQTGQHGYSPTGQQGYSPTGQQGYSPTGHQGYSQQQRHLPQQVFLLNGQPLYSPIGGPVFYHMSSSGSYVLSPTGQPVYYYISLERQPVYYYILSNGKIVSYHQGGYRKTKKTKKTKKSTGKSIKKIRKKTKLPRKTKKSKKTKLPKNKNVN